MRSTHYLYHHPRPHTGSTPKASDVFRLFCSLEAGLTVRDLCNRNDLSAMGINERCIIALSDLLYNYWYLLRIVSIFT